MTNTKIAAAIALALGTGMAAQGAHAAAATADQCAAATNVLYVAGSSAAQQAFATALTADLFDANGETTLSPTSSATFNGNFKAYCGFAKAGNTANIATGAVVNLYYRAEGGSVVGALPIAANKPIKFLDLTAAGCNVAAPAVTGLSKNVGTTDGWTGCVTTHAVEMGITDVEPGLFNGTNYPSAYSTTVFGSATQTQLAALAPTPLFQQVFGLFVNTNTLNGGSTGQAIDLTHETAASILSGAYGDWSAVPTSTGAKVSSNSVPITIVNREAGSGSRTGATIFFLGVGCSKFPGLLLDGAATADGFATGDVLATAATTNGAITYASIDNSAKQANLTVATIDGVVPSNLAAASGQYGWWFEATAQKQPTIASPGGTNLYNWLTGSELINAATAPHTKNVNAIPSIGTNSGAVPITASAPAGTINAVTNTTIYINPFSKNGNSCSIPLPTNF
jgi:hypothetical protein